MAAVVAQAMGAGTRKGRPYRKQRPLHGRYTALSLRHCAAKTFSFSPPQNAMKKSLPAFGDGRLWRFLVRQLRALVRVLTGGIAGQAVLAHQNALV